MKNKKIYLLPIILLVNMVPTKNINSVKEIKSISDLYEYTSKVDKTFKKEEDYYGIYRLKAYVRFANNVPPVKSIEELLPTITYEEVENNHIIKHNCRGYTFYADNSKQDEYPNEKYSDRYFSSFNDYDREGSRNYHDRFNVEKFKEENSEYHILPYFEQDYVLFDYLNGAKDYIDVIFISGDPYIDFSKSKVIADELLLGSPFMVLLASGLYALDTSNLNNKIKKIYIYERIADSEYCHGEEQMKKVADNYNPTTGSRDSSYHNPETPYMRWLIDPVNNPKPKK